MDRFAGQPVRVFEIGDCSEALTQLRPDVFRVHVGDAHPLAPKKRYDFSDRDIPMTGQYEKSVPTNRIQEALGDRELTWLAKQTKLPLSTLSEYNRGTVPRVDKAIAIARALSVNVEWLFGDATDPSPAPEIGSQQEEDEKQLIGSFRLLGDRERQHVLQNIGLLLELVAVPSLGTLSPGKPTVHSPRDAFKAETNDD